MAKSKKSIQISEEAWKAYTDKLYNVSATAGKKMEEYILKHGLNDRNALIDYAYGLVTKYSEGTSALAAQMYDEIAAAENALTLSAEVIATPSYDEVAKTVHGTLKRSKNEKSLGGAIQYLVKRNGADTVLHNALRDHAQFAWIPGAGETCSFCRMLASNGWRYMSKKALKNGHAQHIHANCRCTYAIRFSEQSNIQGYDPDKYYQEYVEAGRDVNEMRRLQYRNNKELADKIKAQKREAYAKRRETELFNNDVKYGKIIIDGDEFVPCLRDTATGQLVDTLVEEVSGKTLKGYNEKTGWYVNWSKIPREASIYKLTVKGSDEIQGLIAMTPMPSHKAMYLNWVVAAPQNNPMLLTGKAKRYEGVGGHLMAIAAEKSIEMGYEGAAYGYAANAKLAKYYVEKFKGTLLPIEHPYEVFYSEDAMKKLLEMYNYEWKR